MSDKDSDKGGRRQEVKLGAEPTHLAPEIARQLYDALRKSTDEALRSAHRAAMMDIALNGPGDSAAADRETLIRYAPPWVREAIAAIRAAHGEEATDG